MKKLFESTFIGIGIALFISAISMALTTSDAQVKWSILSTIAFGAVAGGASVVYQFKRLSHLMQVLIHFGLSLAAFLLAAYVNHWFPMEVGIILGQGVVFMGLFFISWTYFYVSTLKEIKHINQRLKMK